MWKTKSLYEYLYAILVTGNATDQAAFTPLLVPITTLWARRDSNKKLFYKLTDWQIFGRSTLVWQQTSVPQSSKQKHGHLNENSPEVWVHYTNEQYRIKEQTCCNYVLFKNASFILG